MDPASTGTDAATPATTTPPTPDALLLLPLRQQIQEQALGVRAIHVHRDGHEDLVHRYVGDTWENIYSVSKTITALAVGIAIEEGLLDLEDHLVDVLPVPDGVTAGEGIDRIRLRHLITMTGGNPVLGFVDEERLATDVVEQFYAADLAREPGTAFEYSNMSIHLLARAVEERSGTGLREYLMPRLFLPLGIRNPQWHTTAAGHAWGATGLYLRSGELANIGRLLLQRGRWETDRLVPADWIDAMHAPQNWVETGERNELENLRYGFGVWDCTLEDAWRADGAQGQFILVMPAQRAVVTITSRHESGPTQDILRAVWSQLVPLL